MGNVVLVVLSIAVFAAGLVVVRFVGRKLLGWTARRQASVEHRGTLYSSDMVVRVALIGVWAGGALGSIAALPAVLWALDGDGEAGRAALSILGVSVVIIGLSVLTVLVGMRFFVLESDRLTRVSAFGERSIALASVERFDEASGLPALRIHGNGSTMRISKTTAGFDDLFNRLTDRVPVPYDVSGLGEQETAAPTGLPHKTVNYAVSTSRRALNLITMIVTLIFVLAWPWFLVDGEHVIRDSFIFVGIGFGLWLAIVLLVRTETSPAGQPIELQLAPSEIRWRLSRGDWQTRAPNQLMSASVETKMIYVRGQPGHRYPLRLRFTDGTVVQIDDQRARHLGSSTQLLGLDIRRRYLITSNRSDDDRIEAARHLSMARELETVGDTRAAVSAYGIAIGYWPNDPHLALHRHCGDLLRRHADSLVSDGAKFRKETAAIRADAIGHYRAHLDAFPYDADAWQAIAVCVGDGYQTDLADESIASAEQLLLSGRHTPTEHLRADHGPR